jgi:hypothetical protein
LTTNRKTVLTRFIAILVIVLVFSFTFPNAQAQTATTFTPSDKFSIPALQGAISFALNGSCSSTTLENDSWVFKDLRLNGSQSLGTLKISTQNSNITINSFYGANYSSRRLGYLRYYIEGQGKQIVNLGFNSSKPSSASEWSVIVPNSVFLAEGEGWNLLPDNTLIINNLSGSVTVVRYSFGVLLDDSNQTFYQKHYVFILTAVAVALTVSIASVIKIKSKARK